MRIVLSFAHTIGEFGVVLMIGGNLPGITRTSHWPKAIVAITHYLARLVYRLLRYGQNYVEQGMGFDSRRCRVLPPRCRMRRSGKSPQTDEGKSTPNNQD